MLNIYKTFILINNIIFADSNKSINDKIFEIELELEKCLFGSNDNDSEKYQYSTRTIKGLLDSNSRILFNKFIEWYDYLMNINKLLYRYHLWLENHFLNSHKHYSRIS